MGNVPFVLAGIYRILKGYLAGTGDNIMLFQKNEGRKKMTFDDDGERDSVV